MTSAIRPSTITTILVVVSLLSTSVSAFTTLTPSHATLSARVGQDAVIVTPTSTCSGSNKSRLYQSSRASDSFRETNELIRDYTTATTSSISPTGPSAQQRKIPLLEQFSEGYTRLTKEHYLGMAFLQAGVLASIADITTQSLEQHSATGGAMIDFSHVLAMATVASTMSGVANAIWLRQLESAFPGKETQAVVLKTLIHAIIIASIINSAYLVGVPILSDHIYNGESNLISMFLQDPNLLRGGWTMNEFWILTKLEICMFIPYNTIAFKFIPPSIRPLTHAAVSATFNIAVSAVTLGYFDTWYERFISASASIF